MGVWCKVDSDTRYAVAISSYHEDKEHRLKLTLGETVYIEEETDGWYRGYTSKNKQERGIFPKSYVHLKEATVTVSGSMEIIQTTDPAIAVEITSVLREWSIMLYQLYEIKDPLFSRISTSMYDLMEWRSKILSRKLTVDELRELKQKATNKIDSGNVRLQLDLVVRDEEGNILNPEKTSTTELYRQHVIATKRIQSENSRNSTEVESKPSKSPTFGLYVLLHNFVCRIGEDADILMNLYDEKTGSFISENYVVKWGKEGMPKDIDMLNNCRVVFTDLGFKDREREKVYLLFQVVRIGTMDPRDVDNKKQTQGLRRPFGIAALDITAVIQETQEINEDTQLFIPFHPCGEREFLETMIKKTDKDFNHKGQGLFVSIKILQGDLQQIWDDFPHLVLPGTAVSRKMGFPEVIMPGDVRNDIYITLMQGEFNKGSKTSEKNVEVTIQVCNQNGETLQNVISEGAGGEMMSEYKSCIYYHEDRPKWFETVKVAISTEEEFKGLHLKFLFKHRSSNEGKDKLEKAFAMAFIKLMNDDGTTLKDTTHELLIYKLESKKVDGFRGYLDLFSTRAEMDNANPTQSNRIGLQKGLILSPKDSVLIKTYVCSTKLTHNVNLLGLLKWQEILHDTDALKWHLEELMHVDGEEIVKFLQDLLDSLFNILMQNINSDNHENLVFTALIHIISLISDRKYHQFRPVLDAYISNTFSFAMAYSKLMAILKEYIDCANESQDTLLIAMKSLEYIFKFIIRSRVLFSIINVDRGREQFEITLKQLLNSINTMMRYTTNKTLLVQGAALKFMTTTIPHVITVFSPLELSKLLVEFFDNIHPERLSKQKMKSINDLVHSELFKRTECRQILLPMILSHTAGLLDNQREMEGCAMVLNDIMDNFYHTRNENDLSTMMQRMLRTVIQTVIQMSWEIELVGNFVAVMMAILSQMNERHYRMYIESFPYRCDVQDFLTEILIVLRLLITKNVYKVDWNDMILLQNSIILRALRCFAHTINDEFSSPFLYELWNSFFFCAVSFLTQDPLQLEKFSANKRTKIISRYKDMRREMGFEIRSMWFNLGQNKSSFIPGLVGKILEMTLVPETELRKATIPIFFDMMQCEFLQMAGRGYKHNFFQVENQMITELDDLVEGGRGDEQYMELMYETLKGLFEKNKYMMQQGQVFVEMIRKLLQHLLEYRSIIRDEVKEHRMSCIVNLLNFYQEIDRQEMYVRYLHKLCDLHLDCDNYNEAACALMQYAKLLQWSSDPIPPMLESSKYQECKNQSELKEKLYCETIKYFEQGKIWEKGIELSKELANQYENEVFDYESLSALLKRQADLYDSIMKKEKDRHPPEYFRVAYYGKAYPSFLQNKMYIHRGKEYERLSDFSARLQTMFPNAELLKTLSTPGEDITSSNKQYLQINAVNPIQDLKEQFKNKTVSEPILKYYSVNEIQKFSYSRRLDESVSDVKDMWLERTILVTSHPFPGILQWFPVVSTEVVKVSPLETAIETLEGTNKKLRTLIDQHIKDPNLRPDALTMLVNGVVDPAVNKGILNYKEFYSSEYSKANAEKKNITELVSKLKELTLNQGILLREALRVHKRCASETLKPLQAHMEQRFSELCNLIEKECGIRIADKGFTSSVKRNQSSLSMASRNSSGSIAGMSDVNSTGSSSPTIRNNPTMRSRSISCVQVANANQERSNSLTLTTPLKNIIKRASQVSEHSSSTSSSQRNSAEQLIELNEQLSTKRPPRPDPERRNSRPASQFRSDQPLSVLNISASSLCSNTSTNTQETSEPTSDDSESSGEPPPLPEKQAYADYTNTIGDDSPIIPQRLITKTGQKNKPPPPIPVEEECLPPVPRKPPLPR